MLSVREFYSENNWTLGFWEPGANYTIVPGRHIGLDIAPGRAQDIPALYGGHVIIVTKTRTMGWIVVLDTHLEGSSRYHSYCHLSAVDLPRPKDYIYPGQRVAKLAAGPKTLHYESAEFPGSLWTGVHLHLVMSSFSTGAYTKNTGSTYANPESFIRRYFAGEIAGGGAEPFDPEEDELNAEEKQKFAEMYGWMKGLAFGDFPKAASSSGDQPIKWWLQALANQGNEMLPLVKDTQRRVRGDSPRGDMLQLIMEKLNTMSDSTASRIAEILKEDTRA